MKLFYAVAKMIATVTLVWCGLSFSETEPTAAAIYMTVGVWLAFKDGDK